nr:penicillin-binding protein activator [Panacagrimonas sp.]
MKIAIHRAGRAALLTLLLCATYVAHAAPPIAPRPVASPINVIGEAEAAIAAGDDRAAETLLSRIPNGSLDAFQLGRVQMVRAEIGLKRRQPDTVLRSLPPPGGAVSPLSSRIEQIRASAYFMLGDVVAAVRTLVARERMLTSAGAIADNREQIWGGLIATPFSPSALDRLGAEDPMTRGWLDLARVLQQGPSSANVAAWSQRNPGHPGAAKAALVRPSDSAAARGPMPTSPSLGGAELPRTSLSGGYALLLPVTGNLASAGRAVRDGFIAAWFATPEPRPPVRVYDTGNEQSQAAQAYQAAVRDGAGTLIGPLTKEGVVVVAGQGVNIPWLTLNYVDGTIGGALQFGLAPEDEARAVAADAISMGRTRALALIPSTPWGERALAAFRRSFEEQGGTVLQASRFPNGAQDFGKPLRDLLMLDASNQRHVALEKILGEKSEFEARPREDADLLFAPLRAVEARLLVPQLDFFHVRHLPAYALSVAHSGQVDRQVDGLRLCDMPWVVDDRGPWASERERLRNLFPEAIREQPRLFALGTDALRIVRARDPFTGGREIDGATGRLTALPDGHVVRALACRPIVDGRPTSAPPPLLPVPAPAKL